MQLYWRLHQNPLVNASSPLLRDLSTGNLKFTTARFATIAQGGFGDAALAFASPPDEIIRDAVDNWLMRRVVATDAQGRIAYEGFVAGVHATMGHHAYVRSMDSFHNITVAEFQWAGSHVGYGKCPKGAQCKGRLYSFESDVDPVGRTLTLLGPKEFWFQAGKGVIAPALAQEEGKVKLRELLKKRGVDIDTEQAQPNALELMIWGYNATLKWQKNTVGYKKYTEVSQIVKDSLYVADSAPFISTDTAQIQTTGKTILFNAGHDPQWVFDLIQMAIAAGDSNARILFFQIWEDRRPWLYARATSPRYFSRSDDNHFYDASRAPIPDYMVRAGGIVVAESEDIGLDKYSDVLGRRYRGLIERTDYDDLREKVTVPAPTDVVMSEDRLMARAYVRLQRRNGRF